jgi:hypothetical protein
LKIRKKTLFFSVRLMMAMAILRCACEGDFLLEDLFSQKPRGVNERRREITRKGAHKFNTCFVNLITSFYSKAEGLKVESSDAVVLFSK